VRSITYAQRTKRVLERYGITAMIVKPPTGLLDNSCGYAVSIKRENLDEAMNALDRYKLYPKRVVELSGGGFFIDLV